MLITGKLKSRSPGFTFVIQILQKMKMIQVQEVSVEELVLSISKEVSIFILNHLSKAQEPILLNRRQLKENYGFSYSTISRYVSKGLLTPKRIGGKVFFDKHQVEASIKYKIQIR